jgi:hypothetical protein
VDFNSSALCGSGAPKASKACVNVAPVPLVTVSGEPEWSL